MESKGTSNAYTNGQEMLEDVEYYKYIFKKTEKMVCAVFYITRRSDNLGHTDRVIEDLETTSQSLLTASLESLTGTQTSIEDKAIALRYMLLSFESKLRLAHAARVFDASLLEVFLHEIDSVQRTLRKYTEGNTQNPLMRETMTQDARAPKEPRVVRPRLVESVSQEGTMRENATRSRKDRVLDVIRDKGAATIKDIMEVIKDCSEKTIQRELIGLIKDNVVLREGERRWSKYKLI